MQSYPASELKELKELKGLKELKRRKPPLHRPTSFHTSLSALLDRFWDPMLGLCWLAMAGHGRFKEPSNRMPTNSGSIQRGSANREPEPRTRGAKSRQCKTFFFAEPVRRFDFEPADPHDQYGYSGNSVRMGHLATRSHTAKCAMAKEREKRTDASP